jgi:Dolichyl-phosphate-mannose-protein mannosyltransferase
MDLKSKTPTREEERNMPIVQASSAAVRKEPAVGTRLSWRIALLVILVAGIALRLYSVGYSFNADEIFSLRASSGSLSNLVRATIADRVHPPLYYLLLHSWMKLVGSSEIGVRLLSVLASGLFLLLLADVARKLVDDLVGLFIVAFCATNGYFVYYGQEARPYAFAALFCTASLWCILRIQEEPGNTKLKVYYALSCSAILFTHYIGLLFLLPQFAAVAFGPFREKRGVLFAGFLGVLSVCPWLLVVGMGLSPSAITPNLAWIGKPTWPDLAYIYMQIFGWLPFSNSTRILFLATAVVLVPLVLRSKKPNRSTLALIAGSAVFPILVAFLVSRYGPISILALRQLIGSVIMIVCLLGIGLAAHQRALGLGLGAFLLAWSLLTLPSWLPDEMSPPWRSVARALDQKCNDCEIEVSDLPMQIALSYYSRQHVHSTARYASPAEGSTALPYWMPFSPDRERETDRILFVCAPRNCKTLSYFQPDYQVEAQTEFTWGRNKKDPDQKLEIYILDKSKGVNGVAKGQIIR